MLWNLETNPNHEFSPSFCNIHFNTTLSSESRSSRYFPSFRSPSDILYALSFFFYTCHMLRLSHPPWFDHPRNICWEVQNSKIPRYAIIFSPLLSPPPIFLSTVFSSTFNLSNLSMTVQVSQPYKTEVKSYFCIFNFNILREQARRQNILTWKASDILQISITQFWFVSVIPNTWILSHFQRIY